jgi:hypothetical protein
MHIFADDNPRVPVPNKNAYDKRMLLTKETQTNLSNQRTKMELRLCHHLACQIHDLGKSTISSF